MIGQTLGHYTVVEKLGEGGMGVVYKATDVKLDRTVALKFLPPQASETTETKTRFLQEAKAAAALNHPNICTIHGVEEADGRMFIVMEYVDGGTLRSRIGDTSLSADPVDIAIQVGEALHEAHGKGIVHRDIKTDNIMLNARGQAKVMDFGLAKLKGTLKLTRTSSTVGTLAYMAPEQIQGGQVDARSDIFSFGVLLFELLTGRLPFRGEHEAAMMYSLLNEAPEQLTAYLPDASPELIHILDRSLEKDPNDRYQTVGEMVIDLRRLKKQTTKVIHPAPSAVRDTPSAVAPAARTTSVTINIPSMERKPMIIVGGVLAVLIIVVGLIVLLGDADTGERIPIAVADFVNETNEPELNSLSGMLITSLEQSRRLAVAPRSHMFDILKQLGKADVERIDEPLGKEVARHADIRALVTASIRKFGRLYTIDLKVLDTKTNEYLFTTKKEGEGQESIPGLIDALAEQTRSNLRLPVAESEDAPRIANVTTTNMEAYAHYFRGEDLINRIKMPEARSEYTKAIALDPQFALAHFRLGYTLKWNQQFDAARGPFETAMRLLNRLPAREQYLLRSHMLDLNGEPQKAIDLLKEAERLFALDKEIPYEIGDREYHRGNKRESVVYLQKTLGMDPSFSRALEHLAWCYRDLGMYAELKAIAERYVAASDTTEAYNLLFTAHLGLREYEKALQVLERPASGFSPPAIESGKLLVQILRGDYDGAVRLAESVLRSASTPREMRSANVRLAEAYPYVGRYRDTYKAFDKATELSWSIGDTNMAGYYQVRKAVSMWAAGRPIEEVVSVVRGTFAYQNSIRYGPYWGFRAMLKAEAGDTTEFEYINDQLPTIPSFGWWLGAHLAMSTGDNNRALALIDSISSSGSFDLGVAPDIHFLKARVLLKASSYDAAISSLNAIESVPTNNYGIRAYMLPPSYNLLGQAYERQGDKTAAKEAYQKLLTMWNKADADLPVLIDTKKRLAALR